MAIQVHVGTSSRTRVRSLLAGTKRSLTAEVSKARPGLRAAPAWLDWIVDNLEEGTEECHALTDRAANRERSAMTGLRPNPGIGLARCRRAATRKCSSRYPSASRSPIKINNAGWLRTSDKNRGRRVSKLRRERAGDLSSCPGCPSLSAQILRPGRTNRQVRGLQPTKPRDADKLGSHTPRSSLANGCAEPAFPESLILHLANHLGGRNLWVAAAVTERRGSGP
jgi:hypothetical protein